MNIVGHGIDIVEVARIRRLLEKPESDFLDEFAATLGEIFSR